MENPPLASLLLACFALIVLGICIFHIVDTLRVPLLEQTVTIARKCEGYRSVPIQAGMGVSVTKLREYVFEVDGVDGGRRSFVVDRAFYERFQEGERVTIVFRVRRITGSTDVLTVARATN